jgi:hypothetical protein
VQAQLNPLPRLQVRGVGGTGYWSDVYGMKVVGGGRGRKRRSGQEQRVRVRELKSESESEKNNK